MSSFRHFISKASGAPYPPEKGRYHYYMAYACPFVGRSLTALYLNNLEDYFTFTVAHSVKERTRPNDPEDTYEGWMFVDPAKEKTVTIKGKEYPTDGCTPDTVNNKKFIRDIYDSADNDKHPYTVPMVFDKKTMTIVNSESADQVRMFSKAFEGLTDAHVDLVPEDIEKDIDAMNDGLNSDVMKAWASVTFRDGSPDELYEQLEKLDKILAKEKYLVGGRLTESDVRMFHTLLRLDMVTKDDMKKLIDYPNVAGYMQELYQIPAFKKTVHFPHLKLAFSTNPAFKGPFVDYDAPSSRK